MPLTTQRSDQGFTYIGSELELFAQATNWKAYWASMVRRLMGPRVLDVGAGIGATAQVLCNERTTRWLSLEPDPKLIDRLRERQADGRVPRLCEARRGTVGDLSGDERFDTILYIDVLEHIEKDADELRRAAAHLDAGGRLIALAPAHRFLFTPFDAAIGHYRRYDRGMISALSVPSLSIERIAYLDSVGMLASIGNKLLLRSAMPTATQIKVWDKLLVPVSRVLDRILLHRLGKSILAVWRRR